MPEWLLGQQGIWVYVIIFAALLGGAVGLPIPEDLPLIGAGVAVHRGHAKPLPIFVICYVAILLGDIIIYLIGRRFGSRLFSLPWFERRFNRSRIRKVRFDLERRSLPMIFIARHLFYLRTVTFLACGSVKMKFSRFIVADALAGLISVPLMLSLGYIFAEQLDGLQNSLHQARHWALMVGVIILIVGVILWRKQRSQPQPPPEAAESPMQELPKSTDQDLSNK